MKAVHLNYLLSLPLIYQQFFLKFELLAPFKGGTFELLIFISVNLSEIFVNLLHLNCSLNKLISDHECNFSTYYYYHHFFFTLVCTNKFIKNIFKLFNYLALKVVHWNFVHLNYSLSLPQIYQKYAVLKVIHLNYPL